MSTSSSILIVACNQRNLELLSQFLGKTGYGTKSVSNLQSLGLTLESNNAYGLALIDISGFDRGIWSHCEKLSAFNIPLLVVAPQTHQHLQYQIYAYGAKGILFKPLVMKRLMDTVSQLFVEA